MLIIAIILIFISLSNIDFIIRLSHLCRDFVNYFKERVVPKANRLGKWALGEVNNSKYFFFS